MVDSERRMVEPEEESLEERWQKMPPRCLGAELLGWGTQILTHCLLSHHKQRVSSFLGTGHAALIEAAGPATAEAAVQRGGKCLRTERTWVGLLGLARTLQGRSKAL